MTHKAPRQPADPSRLCQVIDSARRLAQEDGLATRDAKDVARYAAALVRAGASSAHALHRAEHYARACGGQRHHLGGRA